MVPVRCTCAEKLRGRYLQNEGKSDLFVKPPSAVADFDSRPAPFIGDLFLLST